MNIDLKMFIEFPGILITIGVVLLLLSIIIIIIVYKSDDKAIDAGELNDRVLLSFQDDLNDKINEDTNSIMSEDIKTDVFDLENQSVEQISDVSLENQMVNKEEKGIDILNSFVPGQLDVSVVNNGDITSNIGESKEIILSQEFDIQEKPDIIDPFVEEFSENKENKQQIIFENNIANSDDEEEIELL